tara:strand:+ start:76 stop:429 length:354 start_codon:yes stop_codon:yes gene_type:complete
MATLTPKLSLHIDSDPQLHDPTCDITLAATAETLGVAEAVTGTIATLLANGDYTASYVYLKNLSNTAANKITITVGAQTLCGLGAQEFAWFPWDGTADIKTTAVAGTPSIQYALYEA